MDIEQKIAHFKDNLQAHGRGDNPLDPWELAQMLDDMGERWREVWTMMPRDQVFDNLYALRPSEVGKRPFLYRRVADDTDSHSIIEWDDGLEAWSPVTGASLIIEWLIDNPPFPVLEPIAELYQYAQSLERKQSPWVLFVTLVAGRVLVQLKSGLAVGDTHVVAGRVLVDDLIPLGTIDAGNVGRALTSWSEYSDTAGSYVHLVDAYDAATGGNQPY